MVPRTVASEPEPPVSPVVAHSTREALVVLSLAALALSAYLAFLTAHYSYDAVASGVLLYQWMTSGDIAPLFHRYHVLYLPAAAAVEAALRRSGVEVDPLTLLQILNACFGAASVALYYRLARAFGLGLFVSVTLALLFGGGFAFWYHSTNGESYPISICFLLLAFLSMLRLPERPSWPRALAPGAWLGIAAGFHGTCLLALPGLAVLAWPREGRRDPFRRLVAMFIAAGVVCAVPHLLSYLALRPDAALAGLGSDAAAFAGEKGWSAIPRARDQWIGLVRSMAPSDWPALASPHPAFARLVRGGLCVTALLPLVLVLGVERSRRRLVLGSVVWLVVGFCFFSCYFAGSPKFTSYLWAPLLLLVGCAVEQLASRRSVGRVALPALAAVAVATVGCSLDLVRLQVDGNTNPHLVRARAIARLTEPDDVIVHLGRGEHQHLKVYVPYFAMRRSIVLEPYFDARIGPHRSAQAVHARLAAAASGPGRVVVLPEAIAGGPPALDFERATGIPEGSLASLFAAYRPQSLGTDAVLGTLWVLDPSAFRDPGVQLAVDGD